MSKMEMRAVMIDILEFSSRNSIACHSVIVKGLNRNGGAVNLGKGACTELC